MRAFLSTIFSWFQLNMTDLNFISLFGFALSVTIPIFVVVLLGFILRRIDFINDDFIRIASNFVFNIGLPTALFISVAKTDLSRLANFRLIIISIVMTIIVIALSAAVSLIQVKEKRDRGIYVQGAYRGNLIIVGLAFCTNAYGDIGLAIASLPAAILIALYNIIAVYILNTTLSKNIDQSLYSIILGVIKNPLIIGILCGLLFNLTGLSLPGIALDTGSYFSQMSLPLALLCIGGAMDLSSLRTSGSTAVGSTVLKLLISPLVVCLLAIPLQIRGQELGILFLLAASPTAAASFIMVKSMGGNAPLAANIVVLTTLCSLFTVTMGLILLKYSGFI